MKHTGLTNPLYSTMDHPYLCNFVSNNLLFGMHHISTFTSTIHYLLYADNLYCVPVNALDTMQSIAVNCFAVDLNESKNFIAMQDNAAITG